MGRRNCPVTPTTREIFLRCTCRRFLYRSSQIKAGVHSDHNRECTITDIDHRSAHSRSWSVIPDLCCRLACSTTNGTTLLTAGMARPSLVLVHGSFGTAAGWAPFRAAMTSRGYEVYAIDLPWDKSPRTGGLPDLQDYVDTLVKFVTSKQLKNVALVGHSFGGVPISLALEGESLGIFIDLSGHIKCFVGRTPLRCMSLRRCRLDMDNTTGSCVSFITGKLCCIL